MFFISAKLLLVFSSNCIESADFIDFIKQYYNLENNVFQFMNMEYLFIYLGPFEFSVLVSYIPRWGLLVRPGADSTGILFSPTSGPPPLEEPGSPKLPLCALSGWAVCASLGHPQVVPSQRLGTAQPPAWRKASRCPFQPRATDTNTQHPSPKVFSKALNPVHRLAPESPGTTQHPLFTPPRF